MVTKVEPILESVAIKRPLTLEQKGELLQQISDARYIIEQQTAALDIHKDNVKAEVKKQEDIVSQCIEQYRAGHIIVTIPCSVSYLNGEAIYTDKNGEIQERRPITEQEQLRLNNNAVDAETIIRQARANED